MYVIGTILSVSLTVTWQNENTDVTFLARQPTLLFPISFYHIIFLFLQYYSTLESTLFTVYDVGWRRDGGSDGHHTKICAHASTTSLRRPRSRVDALIERGTASRPAAPRCRRRGGGREHILLCSILSGRRCLRGE